MSDHKRQAALNKDTGYRTASSRGVVAGWSWLALLAISATWLLNLSLAAVVVLGALLAGRSSTIRVSSTWYVFQQYQLDIVIAGRLLTKDGVGIYSVSMHLATLPMQKIMGMLGQVVSVCMSCRFDAFRNRHVSIRSSTKRAIGEFEITNTVLRPS